MCRGEAMHLKKNYKTNKKIHKIPLASTNALLLFFNRFNKISYAAAWLLLTIISPQA